MIASELSSWCISVVHVVSLQALALNRSVPETLSEVVLRAVSSAMAAISHYWNYNLPILLVIREDALETVTQVVEVSLLRNLGLEHLWLD